MNPMTSPARRIQPRLPKGMRDFTPTMMLRREYVYGIVREAFERFGFEPMQTPVLELHETLMGKYGEDADKLIFNAQHPGGKEALALRYDLTVPLARFYAMYANDLPLPFKRYQITPVWRAERPQRGRYREFYQCDVDTVGAAGAAADAELVAVTVAALSGLGLGHNGVGRFTIKINNRKLLTAIGLYAGLEGQPLAELYRSIDKFDKVGADGVRAELAGRGVPAEAAERIMALILIEGDSRTKLDALARALGGLPIAQEALAELREVLAHLAALAVPAETYAFDFTMVRGLGYYTGPIFETVIDEPNLGSVMGGGRYDDLIGLFTGSRVPTTGMSLGIERIIDVLEELDLYPPGIRAARTRTEVLVAVFDDATRPAAEGLASALRAAGVRTELYLLDRPIGRQFAYADKKGIPLVAVIGTDEAAAGAVKFKRLHDAHEVTVLQSDAARTARALLAE
jgi:histidyl-tRNA synthetase